MPSGSRRLSRRTFLRGVGTAVALPLLDAMRPSLAYAAWGEPSTKPPLRLAYVYVPNGKHMPDWTPKAEGAGFELPKTLEPLKKVKDQLLVISGLTCDKARANGDGAGDHARAMAAFLTGCQPRKTHGADIKAGISIDQLAAARIGHQTKLPSLELGCDRGMNSGNCDSGYSCAYSANISWRSEATPMPKEVDPKLVFERLFGENPRAQHRQSVLDFVLEDAKAIRGSLGAVDRRKLDEYLHSVREVERRIGAARGPTKKVQPTMAKPNGIPAEYEEHIKLMSDLMVLAFQTDTTRICTFVHANEGSNRPYRFIGVPEGHHDLSHHSGSHEKQEKIQKINEFHTRLLGYTLEKLAAIQEGDGTLLDHTILLYGSGIGDGNRHNHDDLPILLAGRGCGTLRTGRHLRVPNETPLTNLYLSLLDRVGVHEPRFGDSTGRLTGLT